MSSQQNMELYPGPHRADLNCDLQDVVGAAQKRAWNSHFSGGLGKRAWNSHFSGGLGKRAWNSNFNGGIGKRAWNKGFTGILKRIYS